MLAMGPSRLLKNGLRGVEGGSSTPLGKESPRENPGKIATAGSPRVYSRQQAAVFQQPARPGRLLYLVGPSGAGKDSLLGELAARPPFTDRLSIARRTITRPADLGDEGHEAVTTTRFRELEAAGAFALTWRAHDCAYGIRRGIDDDLAAGRAVAVCGSRGAIDAALARYPDTRVVLVTATAATLARRLAARGREDADAVERRLQRASTAAVALRPGWMVVANDGDFEAALAVLQRIAATCLGSTEPTPSDARGGPLACPG